MCKHDVMHKTGSIQRIAKPQKEDRAAAVGNMHEKIGEDWACISGDCWRRDIQTDAPTDTHTHKQTNILITIRRLPESRLVDKQTAGRLTGDTASHVAL